MTLYGDKLYAREAPVPLAETPHQVTYHILVPSGES